MWTKLSSDAGRGARRAHTTCVVEHWMLLFGGRSKTLESLGDLCVLDLGAMTWQALAISNSPSPRRNHTASAVGKQMFIFGGDNGTLMNDFHVFDTGTWSWSVPSFTGVAPSPRYAHSAVVSQHRIVIFGGSSADLLSDLHIYDTDTSTFSQPICYGSRPPGRCGHAAAAVHHWMVVFGGLAGSFLGDLWLLNLGGWNGSMKEPNVMNEMHVLEVQESSVQVRWQAPCVQGSPPSPRNTHSAFHFSSKLFIFGGWDRKAYFSDFYECELGALLQHFALQRLCASWDPEVPPADALNEVVATVAKFVLSREALLREAPYSDVIFNVQGREIPAHKCILASQSTYFRCLFNSGMQEATASVLDVGCAGGQAPSYDAFYAFLRYLYTGQRRAELRYLNELIGVADYYHETELQEWAEERFRRSICSGNVLQLLAEANRLQQEHLVQFCAEFVILHQEEVELRSASSSEVQEVI
eukprot:EG_transcript_8286